MEIIYISFDLEGVSDNPADFGIINAGFTAYSEDRIKLGDFSINLIPHNADPNTIKWWHSTPELEDTYKRCTQNSVDPKDGMIMIRDWIIKISAGKKPVMIAYPTIYDGSLLYHYWFVFLGRMSGGLKCPLFDIIDIRSYASGKLQIPYTESLKAKALKQFVPQDKPHTHTGLDDAEEQMHLYFNIRDFKK